jgi:hypothetical protein
MCEIRTGSAIRAPWTVLGWRFILGGRWVLQDGLAGFRGKFRRELCIDVQKKFNGDNGLGSFMLTC